MLQGYNGQNLWFFLLSFAFILFKAIVAILFLGSAVIGHIKQPLNIFDRLLCFLIASFLILALPLTDEIAAGLIIVFFIIRRFKAKTR